jgi:hypothetical protein
MSKKLWVFNLLAFVMFQFILVLPSIAGDYNVSDIALSPGADMTRLNFAWHTNSAILDGTTVTDVNACAVEIAKKRNEHNKHFFQFNKFPKNSRIFLGTKASAGTDENGAADYYCEVDASNLENQTEYFYRVGDGKGNWSDRYEYATANKNRYGFFYVADSQLGASGEKDYSTSEAKAYIAEYEARLMVPGLTDAQYAEIVTLYVAGTLTTTYPAYSNLNKAIKKLYDTYKVDTTANLATVAALETIYPGSATLAANIVALRAQRLTSQKAAAALDTEGWVETLKVMTEKFPRAAFIMSGGDQVENAREYEWTDYFSAEELTSLPVAPTYGSHDKGVNMDYHFNLPNVSAYGVNTAGADYYFTYGNVLYMVLNMDTTMDLYPRSAPPTAPPSGGGAPPTAQECTGIADDATFAATLAALEATPTDDTTDDPAKMKLDDFSASIDEHETFMQEAIAANPHAKWTIVMWHYSIYSAGNHSAEDVIRAMKVYMVPVIDNLNIDLALMAHDHVYTRTFQMLNDDPQENQMTGRRGEVINPTGTLFITGATSSGSKYYSLSNCYDCAEPDDYYEYVALADDMSRTDDNGTTDDTTDDVVYNFPSFSYIDVDNNSLKISVFRTDTEEMLDSYTIVKQKPPKPKN